MQQKKGKGRRAPTAEKKIGEGRRRERGRKGEKETLPSAQHASVYSFFCGEFVVLM